MNKSELVDFVANDVRDAGADITKAKVEQVVNAIFAADGVLAKQLAKGDDVTLQGFGTFRVRKRKAREGRNPRTGETAQIPARKVVTFRPGGPLRDVVSPR